MPCDVLIPRARSGSCSGHFCHAGMCFINSLRQPITGMLAARRRILKTSQPKNSRAQTRDEKSCQCLEEESNRQRRVFSTGSTGGLTGVEGTKFSGSELGALLPSFHLVLSFFFADAI